MVLKAKIRQLGIPFAFALLLLYSLAADLSFGLSTGEEFLRFGGEMIRIIPMTLFEASFLGIEFTLVRYLVAVPLVILTSELLGKRLEHRDFRIDQEKPVSH